MGAVMRRNSALAGVPRWRRDVWLTAVDPVVTLGVPAGGLATHGRWLGALAGGLAGPHLASGAAGRASPRCAPFGMR